MTDNDRLQVWFDKKVVGELWRDSIGNIGFSYDQSWLEQGFAISQQLSLAVKDYSPPDMRAHRFFANLLPEAGARLHIVRSLRVANSDFELLKAIGGECAGALSILPIGYDYKGISNYKKLNSDELKKIVLRKGDFTFLATEENRPRLSLAGAQDKYAILSHEGDYFLPQDSAASTHILKFEMHDYRHIPAYEYFMTQLAKAIDLPAVECQLKRQDHHHYLLIQRYDRIVASDGKIERLHQEDFCQGLGFSHEQKYQQQNGPSFYDCYRFIQQVSTNPITDADNLLKWQIFNYLAGNSDGHAKNIAIVYKDRTVRLAPFYDLVCTRAIEGVDSRLAFSVGGEFNPSQLTFAHWEKLAKECGVKPKYLLEILYDMATMLLRHVESTHELFEQEYDIYPALQRVKGIIIKQCNRGLELTK